MRPICSATIAAALLVMFGATVYSADLFKGRDEAAFEGTWLLTSIEQDGNKLPPEAVRQLATTLTAHDGTYTVTTAGKTTEHGSFKIRGVARARQLDLLPTSGPFQGKTVQGILEIAGDRLKVCYSFQGGERPKKFATHQFSGLFLAEYHRVAR